MEQKEDIVEQEIKKDLWGEREEIIRHHSIIHCWSGSVRCWLWHSPIEMPLTARPVGYDSHSPAIACSTGPEQNGTLLQSLVGTTV